MLPCSSTIHLRPWCTVYLFWCVQFWHIFAHLQNHLSPSPYNGMDTGFSAVTWFGSSRTSPPPFSLLYQYISHWKGGVGGAKVYNNGAANKKKYLLAKLGQTVSSSLLKGIDRPFRGGVESILIRSLLVNWRLGNFFYLILKGLIHKISKKP